MRLLLAAAGIEFEDQRLAFGSQEWADMKPSGSLYLHQYEIIIAFPYLKTLYNFLFGHSLK